MVLRRYLFVVLGGIAGILVAIAAITFVVDPYGIFQAIMVVSQGWWRIGKLA